MQFSSFLADSLLKILTTEVDETTKTLFVLQLIVLSCLGSQTNRIDFNCPSIISSKMFAFCFILQESNHSCYLITDFSTCGLTHVRLPIYLVYFYLLFFEINSQRFVPLG